MASMHPYLPRGIMSMAYRARAAVVAGLALLAVMFGMALPSPAGAVEPDCKTVVTTVTNRPDNGAGGVWATDTLTRTAVFCMVEVPIAKDAKDTVPVQAWLYNVKVTDVGTFVTLGGAALSPGHKAALTAGAKGKVVGKFQIDFKAPAAWLGFVPKTTADGPTPKTSDWAKAMWTDGYVELKGTHHWEWTYTTCVEKWVEAEYGSDGDIVGKPCPSQSPSATPSASSSSSAPVGVPTEAGNSLPLTGAPVWALVAGGTLLLGVGLGFARGFRKRRPRFQA